MDFGFKEKARETGEVVENGFSEIYVNAAVKDGSDVSELMEVFTQKDRYDFEKFPLISARKKQFQVPVKVEAGSMVYVRRTVKAPGYIP